jgi:hypothetical protein
VNQLRMILALALCAFVLATADRASAQARGLMLAPGALPVARASELRRSILAFKRQKPQAFQAVQEIERAAPRLHAVRRGRLAALGPAFKALGPDALLPMLSLLSFEAHDDQAMSPGASLALRVGLLEAVGHLRDPRALPVLTAIVEHEAAREPEVTRAAVSALGAYASDEVVTLLLSLSRRQGAERDAVLAGLGNCRRTAIAHELARALRSETSASAERQLVDSLAAVGNAWAWQTPPVREHAGDEAEVRRTAAAALVAAFLRSHGSLRDAASNALMVVDAPETPVLIDAAQAGATAEQRAALTALSARFANNPTR